MSSENVKLRYRNFTVDQGYFYMFDHNLDGLYKKTDDGNTAFSFPYDTLTSLEVFSAEFDGVYFWSLESPTGNNITIRRWKIDNYVCKLQQTFSFTDDGDHSYSSSAFSVEHYHTTLVSGVTVSGVELYLEEYYDRDDLMSFTTTDSDSLTIHLGPNQDGNEEDVYVDSVVSGVVTITSGTVYPYAVGDAVNFYTHIWIFNNFDGHSSATGALYKIDAYTGEVIKKYPGGAYKDVRAATFYKVNSFPEFGYVDMLCYVKGTNTLFVNVSEETSAGDLEYYGSMVMDNVRLDNVTVIDVFDIAMDDQNIYRLQNIPDGGSSSWSNYSYLLSSLNGFVTSISLAAYPAMIAANNVSTSTINALVKDQFLQPIVSRLVTFSEDDPVGIISGPNPVNTDQNGFASTIYKSGTAAREVKITAVVEQTQS